jgi:hypothetical protein
MSRLWEAIETYHALLSDEVAAESQAQLDEQQRRRGLIFGQRPLCTVLRPRFMSPEQYRYLQRHVATLLGAFAKAHFRAMADPAFRAQFGLADWEEALIQHDHRFGAPSPTSRLDTFLLPDRDAFAITEYNAETPAAQGYSDVLADVFATLPAMRAFLRRYEVRPVLARHRVVNALLDSFHEWSGRPHEAPTIAILDWREVPTYSEHLLFQDYFRMQGLRCITADPREVEYRNGRLVAGDFHITLIYKRVLISELIDRGGMDHPVVRAVQDGAVCMVNPFACKILHKKASLAVLSDERNSALYTAEEHQAIAEHVPWTRRVEERWTRYRDQSIDLVPFILAQRERLALKANDEYGGKGIVLGWLTAADEWERAVQTALAQPFIVQERITIPSETYPSMRDGRLELHERIMDTAPFIYYGDVVDSCLTRLSTDPLVNVTAGGGSTVPTFLVEPRER